MKERKERPGRRGLNITLHAMVFLETFVYIISFISHISPIWWLTHYLELQRSYVYVRWHS